MKDWDDKVILRNDLLDSKVTKEERERGDTHDPMRGYFRFLRLHHALQAFRDAPGRKH